jgi:hypothetical protein
MLCPPMKQLRVLPPDEARLGDEKNDCVSIDAVSRLMALEIDIEIKSFRK